MKTNHLIYLIVAAAMLIGLAVWSTKSQRATPPSDIGKTLLADLDVNNIRRIEMRQNDRNVVVAFDGTIWAVTNLFGYPADFNKVRENLLTLKEMKILDVERNMDLAGQETTQVDLQNAQGKSLAMLNLGPKRQRSSGDERWRLPDGRYLTRDGGSRVYLVQETLDVFDSNAMGWANTELFNVASADIATIEMTSPAGEKLFLDRQDGSLKLNGLTEEEEFDTSKQFRLDSALSFLRFSDIANPALTVEEMGLSSSHVYRVSLKNGEIYTARIGGAAPGGMDRYSRFDVTLAPAATNDAARMAQEQKVAKLNAALSPWTFLISNYTAESMTLARGDLVKAKQPPPTNAVETPAENAVEAPETAVEAQEVRQQTDAVVIEHVQAPTNAVEAQEVRQQTDAVVIEHVQAPTNAVRASDE